MIDGYPANSIQRHTPLAAQPAAGTQIDKRRQLLHRQRPVEPSPGDEPTVGPVAGRQVGLSPSRPPGRSCAWINSIWFSTEIARLATFFPKPLFTMSFRSASRRTQSPTIVQRYEITTNISGRTRGSRATVSGRNPNGDFLGALTLTLRAASSMLATACNDSSLGVTLGQAPRRAQVEEMEGRQRQLPALGFSETVGLRGPPAIRIR